MTKLKKSFEIELHKIDQMAYQVAHFILGEDKFFNNNLYKDFAISQAISKVIQKPKTKLISPQNKEAWQQLELNDIVEHASSFIHYEQRDDIGLLEYYLYKLLGTDQFKDIQECDLMSTIYHKYMTIYFICRLCVYIRMAVVGG